MAIPSSPSAVVGDPAIVEYPGPELCAINLFKVKAK